MASSTSGTRLAVDIGGTFTDLVLSGADGSLRTTKVPTTSHDVTDGLLEGIAKLAIVPSELEAFVHGTTIALNALLERRTPPVGLITTAGFRDVLEIMRTNRPDMYDHQQEKPVPLVPRRLRREITARMTYTGDAIEDVDPDEVKAIAADFDAAGVSVIAVCLLHAYADPSHEKLVEHILLDVLPDAVISLSSDVSRVWREFERTSTTVSNAATMPIVSRYLESLETALETRGFKGNVLIMQSNGGVMLAADARHRPVATLMSGPVGGVAGATRLASLPGVDKNLITLDIGGTSADVAIIDQGHAVSKTVGQIGAWPVMVPMVDIESIGAGGGSIARVDSFGRLLVGPESAGAVPGPACVGRGGLNATVTDANLVLGRINPAYFAGGELELDTNAARRAITEFVADPYGMTCEEAALGIITVINSTMTRLLWEVMIGRGYDPREFSLVAFGGAGPLHACDLAQTLGITRVLIPSDPGAFSAFGILMADARHDFERMVIGTGSRAGPTSAELAEAFVALEREAHTEIESKQSGYARIDFVRSAEFRYVGQDHALSVDLPTTAKADQTLLSTAAELFHERHARLYGFRRDDTPVELVRIQVSALGRITRPALMPPQIPVEKASSSKGTRALFLDGAFHEAPIYDRSDLPLGAHVTGPAVIEEATSTVYLPPDCDLEVSADGLLRITVSPLEVR